MVTEICRQRQCFLPCSCCRIVTVHPLARAVTSPTADMIELTNVYDHFSFAHSYHTLHNHHARAVDRLGKLSETALPVLPQTGTRVHQQLLAGAQQATFGAMIEAPAHHHAIIVPMLLKRPHNMCQCSRFENNTSHSHFNANATK